MLVTSQPDGMYGSQPGAHVNEFIYGGSRSSPRFRDGRDRFNESNG